MRSPRNKRRERIVAMVPAKIGSTRLAMKNLALVDGKPLIYYPIRAARDSGAFDEVIVNAEDDLFAPIAARYGAGYYRRPDAIVSPVTKTDTVVYDFIRNNPCDIVAWVSPIAPFQTAGEVSDIVARFRREGLDSLMTVKAEQVHCVYECEPVNYAKDAIFAQTQDLKPVLAFVYTLMMWRTGTFMRHFENKGHALLCGKMGYYPVSKLSSLIIKKEEDLMIADHIMRALRSGMRYRAKYDPIAMNAPRQTALKEKR